MLKWPETLKPTAIRRNWFEKISKLSPGLDLNEAAKALREPYGAVRRWAVLFGYQFPDRRRTVTPQQWSKVDWSRRDADIARTLGVTRECVRLVRKSKGVGPSSAQRAIRDFEHYVAAQRERLHGLLVEDVIRHSGTDLPYHVVRRVLRDQEVQAHEPHSPLREINWKLPNRDLAAVWGTSARYIANLRARLDIGPSKWNARRRDIGRSSEYNTALTKEKQRAQAERRRNKANVRQAVPA
ncbi:MAG TPA: hypothetical protein VGI81_25490 [Tepidisphaeraceae bacterium]